MVARVERAFRCRTRRGAAHLRTDGADLGSVESLTADLDVTTWVENYDLSGRATFEDGRLMRVDFAQELSIPYGPSVAVRTTWRYEAGAPGD